MAMKKTIILLLALGVGFSAWAQKETPPEGGTPHAFTLPKRSTFTLDNGIEVTMIPYGSIPKATVRIVVKTGSVHEQEDEVWLSDLMASLMAEGNTTAEGVDMNTHLAKMGGQLSINAGSNTTNLSTTVLAEFADDAVLALAGVLQNPAFPEARLEALRNDLVRRSSLAKSRPQNLANERFEQLLYPDSPYGRSIPNEDLLSAYTMEQVKGFYNAQFGAQRTQVYVAGVFDEEAVKEAITNSLSAWKDGPEVSYPNVEASQFGSFAIIDRPGAPQSTIVYGLPVVPPSHPDFVGLEVTNALLGGSFGSRITSNIREDKGYTYSPSSYVSTEIGNAYWAEAADVTTEFTGASLEQIDYEIKKLSNEVPTEDELKGIQTYMAGIYVLQNSTAPGIIGQLVFLDVHDLPESYLTQRVENIYEITPEKVSALMKQYISPDKMTLVIVGDEEVVEKQVMPYRKE